MNPDLEAAILKKLSSDNIPQSNAPSLQDQMSNLYTQLQSQQASKKIENLFMQSLGQNGMNPNDFEQQTMSKVSLKSVFNKDNLVEAAGIAMSGTVAGMIPLNIGSIGLGIGGASQMLAGFLLSKFAKGGTFGRFASGVFKGGLAVAVGGFTKSINLGAIGGNTTANPAMSNVVE